MRKIIYLYIYIYLFIYLSIYLFRLYEGYERNENPLYEGADITLSYVF